MTASVLDRERDSPTLEFTPVLWAAWRCWALADWDSGMGLSGGLIMRPGVAVGWAGLETERWRTGGTCWVPLGAAIVNLTAKQQH